MKRWVIKLLAIVILIVGVAIWVGSQWDSWFHNPEEQPYSVSTSPTRILLTFGNDGEQSRYVSWMCDTTIHDDAALLLAEGHDTMTIKAIGEVFHSRAGKAAFYRAEMKSLDARKDYHYSVVTNGQQSKWYSFRTHNPKADKFSFMFVGDVQDTIDGKANEMLREALMNHPEVEFVAFGGDLTERPTDAYWAETFRSIDSICTAMPVVNILGNHDYLKGIIKHSERRVALIFPYFLKGMEERGDENHLFSFAYHNASFFLLDSDREAWNLIGQRIWLKENLENTDAKHKIVMLHHPLYSIKRKNNNLIQRWFFNGIIKDCGVDLVMQGHEHAYSHCTSDESPLKGNVCTNKPLYTISHCSPKNYSIHPTERFHPIGNESRYYQIVDVGKETITMRGYDAVSGTLIDSVVIAPSNSPKGERIEW